MVEIVLQNPWALLALPLAWLLLIMVAWRRRFKPFGPFLLRLLILVLVTLALAQPIIPAPNPILEIEPQERLVILVDQSASLGAAGQTALRAEAERLARSVGDSHILFFADRPVLIHSTRLGLAAPSSQAEVSLNPEVSNLAEALLMGSELLKNHSGRIVLLSDGLATGGDTLNAAAQVARQDIKVDVLLPGENEFRAWQNGQNEMGVVKLSVPPALRSGETFDVEVTISSERPISATLRVAQDRTLLAEDGISLEQGLNRFNFTVTAEELGPHTFQADLVIPEGQDRHIENNSLSAFTQVYPTPRVLIVGEQLTQLSRFNTWLQQAGFETDFLRAADMPDRLSELEAYAGMILLNTPARSFELEQMIAIQEFVRSLGRGLLVTGGRDSYTLGRYEDTPLAHLLPVDLEPPPREERPPVALLLIIDHSGSMLERREPPTRLAMAKEAAIRATDVLGPDDLIGVLMFDNQYEWVIPFQQVSDGAELLEVQQQIAQIPPGGGTRILQALEVGLPAIIALDTVVSRHVVLLSDGKSFDGEKTIEDYDLIVDSAVEEDITLSTIAIGFDADQDLLSHLAERGRGRYHFAERPEELPALTISESDILRSQSLQEGDFQSAIFAPHPILRGLFSPLPGTDRPQPLPLTGYLAMTPKPQSEVALQVGPGDPLLTTWGYGLGRVVAWSSDIGQEWAVPWREWPEASRFWGQAVGYTLPAPDLSATLQVDAQAESDGSTTLIVDSLTATGQPVDLARTEGVLVTPGGQEVSITLSQVAPGRYERQLKLSDTGAYQFSVTQIRSGEGEVGATTGFVQPYPAEYTLTPSGAGNTLLEQIATITGGRTFSLGQLNRVAAVAAEEETEADEPVELWPWLLLAAVILWPLEIAWRRWNRLRIQ
jgi:Mg-chelatase subunit ChlD